MKLLEGNIASPLPLYALLQLILFNFVRTQNSEGKNKSDKIYYSRLRTPLFRCQSLGCKKLNKV